jgi:hypothetical protein
MLTSIGFARKNLKEANHMVPQIILPTIKRLSTLSALGFIGIALALSITVPASADSFKDMPPQTKERKGPRPSENIKRLMERKQPELVGSGRVALKNAIAFISWASGSGHDKDKAIREAVQKVRDNKDIINAFCKEVFDKHGSDHSRALIALSLVGEDTGAHSPCDPPGQGDRRPRLLEKTELRQFRA